jgi:exocyst complex component 4
MSVNFCYGVLLICSREHLKTVADVLESLISEKRLLQAAILLVRSLKIINNQDMNEIGAMADLRTYLNGQETARNPMVSVSTYFNSFQALREILIDELHNHLYLKSVFTGTRWSAYIPNQQTCKL